MKRLSLPENVELVKAQTDLYRAHSERLDIVLRNARSVVRWLAIGLGMLLL